ncbi:MAG: class I SAM-dependent methyltransferase, partial [Eubacterium sp.]|nr:class I SAM-dependent methyltransferase [Eubacterium sp.]
MGNFDQKKETQFDQVAKEYEKGLEELLSPYMSGTDTTMFAEYKIQLVQSLLKKKKIRSVLDFGCGTGRSLMYFKKYLKDARNFYGCDVS